MVAEVITLIEDIDKRLGLKPNEDAFKFSKKYPIFAIADGVTLFGRDKNGNYPHPSGAKIVADVFCERSVELLEKNYQDFDLKTVKKAFKYANSKIKEINDKAGRTRKTVNFFDFDFFHATAALAVIKENKLFYGRIHDCQIAVINKNGKIKLSLTEPWKWEAGKRALARRPKNWKSLCEKEKEVYHHKYERNGVIGRGILAGYGVLTGEEAALRYLEIDSLNLEKGDIVLIYTDGFEHYIKLKEFLDIFVNWEKNGEKKTELALKKFSKKQAKRDLVKYGLERTIIAARFG